MTDRSSAASRPFRSPIPVAIGVALSAAAGCGPSGPPTFAEDVAPILYENCARCHRPGGPAPFTLLSYEDARPRAPLIAEMTGARVMPPWLPARTDHAFEGERRLSEEQIATLRRWAEAGAPRGDPAEEPSAPQWSGGWGLGEPDLVVEMADTFDVPAEGLDLFRNFVIPLPVERTRYVRAVELRPGNPRVVHHAVMNVDPTPYSRFAEAREPGPGFDGMYSGSRAYTPGGFFLGWTPGRVPSFNPPGMAWELEPGTDLVLQLHLRPTGSVEPVRARVGLYFTDRPPGQRPTILRMGGQTLDIPAGESDYVVEDSFELPVEIRVLGVYPHAHYLGREMLVEARLPEDGVDTLLHIPEWDFNWQDAYRYAEPVALPAGTTLRMRYVYDNSAANPQNPNRPPRRVVLGYRSTDEMAELHFQVVAAHPGEQALLEQQLGQKSLRDQVEAWQHMLSLDPADPEAHFGLGTVLQARGRLDEAAERYRRAVAGAPRHPQAQYNLGLVLEAQGDTESAMRHYREALDAFPEYANAHNNLGGLLAARGRSDEALVHFRAAVEVDPGHADAHNNLGNLFRERGALGEAEGHYRRALAARGDRPEAHFNLAAVLLARGRVDEAVERFDEGARLDPEALQPHVAMAWALATAPDPERRRPDAAIRLAERAARMTGGRHPLVLDVLAASYAAAGRFDEAVRMAGQAEAAAAGAGEEELARRIRSHRDVFRAGEPWVEGGGNAGEG